MFSLSRSTVSFSVITRVEVIPAGRRLYALLMLTSNGAVENRVCRLEYDLNPEQIDYFVWCGNDMVGVSLTEKDLLDLNAKLNKIKAPQ